MTRVPTLVWSSARAGAIAAQVAASHQASRRGVPSTGRLPEPTASAVSALVTVCSRVADRPVSTRPHGLVAASNVEVTPPCSSIVTALKVM